MKTLPAIMVLALGVAPLFAEQKPAAQANPTCPMHFENVPSAKDRRQEGVLERGDEMMGFSHEKTTHHFRLYPDGGSVEAEANASEDAASREQIRSHLAHIATMFRAGDFRAPAFIHAQNPPGTEAMKRLRGEIRYKLETTKKGARMRISTKDPEALHAVHEFLRFQISDHQTGDSLEVTKLP
jgi:hypothetical protein